MKLVSAYVVHQLRVRQAETTWNMVSRNEAFIDSINSIFSDYDRFRFSTCIERLDIRAAVQFLLLVQNNLRTAKISKRKNLLRLNHLPIYKVGEFYVFVDFAIQQISLFDRAEVSLMFPNGIKLTANALKKELKNDKSFVYRLLPSQEN